MIEFLFLVVGSFALFFIAFRMGECVGHRVYSKRFDELSRMDGEEMLEVRFLDEEERHV